MMPLGFDNHRFWHHSLWGLCWQIAEKMAPNSAQWTNKWRHDVTWVWNVVHTLRCPDFGFIFEWKLEVAKKLPDLYLLPNFIVNSLFFSLKSFINGLSGFSRRHRTRNYPHFTTKFNAHTAIYTWKTTSFYDMREPAWYDFCWDWYMKARPTFSTVSLVLSHWPFV